MQKYQTHYVIVSGVTLGMSKQILTIANVHNQEINRTRNEMTAF